MPERFLLELALILASARAAGEVCERWLRQPAVLGEIVVGAILGPAALAWLHPDAPAMAAVAELGAVLLLFEVGLESDLRELGRVGGAALSVAAVGVALPFVLGHAVGAAMHLPSIQCIFMGAALTATSVGITARVFTDLHVLQTPEARVVLGAAVADDVIGLIILAAVSALAVTRTVSVGSLAGLTAMAILFLVLAIVIGLRAAPVILRVARAMRTRAAVSSAALCFCLALATVASMVHLAPIVGAFAAGLALAGAEHRVHFEERIRSASDLLIPVFFVSMGARIDLRTLNPLEPAGRANLILGLLLLAVAVVGKVAAGFVLPRRYRRLAVGVGMIPRGEVGLIFAGIGLSSGVINGALYSSILFVVAATTLITPPILRRLWAGFAADPPSDPAAAA